MARIEVDGVEVETEPDAEDEKALPKSPVPLGGRKRGKRFPPPPDGLTQRQEIEGQIKTTGEAVWNYMTRETKDTLDEILDEGDNW